MLGRGYRLTGHQLKVFLLEVWLFPRRFCLKKKVRTLQPKLPIVLQMRCLDDMFLGVQENTSKNKVFGSRHLGWRNSLRYLKGKDMYQPWVKTHAHQDTCILRWHWRKRAFGARCDAQLIGPLRRGILPLQDGDWRSKTDCRRDFPHQMNYYYMYFCGEYLEDHPSKWLVTPIYMSHESPFGRGRTPGLGELTITMVINHFQVMEWSFK